MSLAKVRIIRRRRDGTDFKIFQLAFFGFMDSLGYFFSAFDFFLVGLLSRSSGYALGDLLDHPGTSPLVFGHCPSFQDRLNLSIRLFAKSPIASFMERSIRTSATWSSLFSFGDILT